MPGVSRAQRAEAKYNVVFDFPNLGLHSAAMSGNIGLVKYALDHGQPVNSALDGVLPLHAASFGGSELAVKTLIEYGADVNAARLPRRYSTDKHRGTAPPLVITGASGSTSLHFAAMHGHAPVVLTLLLHGAHPDRMDKHGLTPEMIARQNGYTDCADVLRQWAHNKDRDLREREVIGSYSVDDQSTKDERGHAYCGSLECFFCATRKRIRMKRSIDNAFHILRHSSSSTSAVATPPHSAGSISASNSMQPPSPTDRPFGKYTFYPTNPESAVEDLPPRRPSLPDVFEVPRSASTAHRTRRPSNLPGASSNRPRSAGSDAEPGVGHRVKGKISLLNIFKRSLEGTPDSHSPASSAMTSTSVSPAPASTLAMSTRSSETLASSTADSSMLSSAGNQLHQRMLGDPMTSTPPPTGLHHAASRESVRGTHSLVSNDPFAKASPSTRPGILRAAHGRSSSSGQSSQGDPMRSASGPASVRALRFDPTSPGVSSGTRRSDSRVRNARAESRSPSRLVRGRGSANSLRSRSPESPWGMRMESEPEPLQCAGPEAAGKRSIEEDEDGAYGQPVQPQVGMHELQMRLSDLDARTRRMSIDSRASDLDSQDTISHRFECPFSINKPPPNEEDDASSQLPPPARVSLDSRLRGNSMSSMVTDSSGGPPSSCVPTPSLQHPNLPGPFIFSPSMAQIDLPSPGESPEKKELAPAQASPGRRARGPIDIDIRQISSHAQAEALVQRAQQRILSMNDDFDVEEGTKTFGINIGEGHTPLSAKLAAYGESLAIERKFKEEEEKKRRSLVIESPSDRRMASHGGPVQRKLSLQERAHSDPTTLTMAELRRPHTSDGEQHSESADYFLSPGSNVVDLSISDPGRHSKLHHLAASASSTPSSHYKTRSETLALPVERPPLPRSRTPDPDASYGSLTSGMPLTRFPTCPAEDTLIPRNDLLSKQERQAARAQKLAKMGFSSGTDPFKESPSYARNQRHHRFGGIKTFVQTLTGRV